MIVLDIDECGDWSSVDSVVLPIFEDRDDGSTLSAGRVRGDAANEIRDSAEPSQIEPLLLWSGKKKSRKNASKDKIHTHWKEIDLESGKCRSMRGSQVVEHQDDKKKPMKRKKTSTKRKSNIKSINGHDNDKDKATTVVGESVPQLVDDLDSEDAIERLRPFDDSQGSLDEMDHQMKQGTKTRDDNHHSFSSGLNSSYGSLSSTEERAAVAIRTKQERTVAEAQVTVLTALLRSTQAQKAKSEKQLVQIKQRFVDCQAENAKRKKQIAEMKDLLAEMRAENALLRGRVSALEKESRSGYP